MSLHPSKLRPVEYTSLVKRMSRQYGINAEESRKLLNHPRYYDIKEAHYVWRERYGFPAEDSPLSRGKLIELIDKE